MADLIGNEVWSNSQKRGQVYSATHDGEGNALSRTQRSHISFSWGGRDIEEFDLLVVSDGGTYQGQVYAPFEDLTTQYDLLDGQHYWASHFNANALMITLATDGILESSLQDFRNWFRPSIERELILAEHPYRAIKARMAEAPTYTMLPFEERVSSVINGQTYYTSTTMWRGSVSLHFVMDDPYWYSLVSNFDMNDTLGDNEIKAIVDEGIPHAFMFKVACLLPNSLIINSEKTIETLTDGITLTKNTPINLYYCGTGAEKPSIYFSFKVDQFDSNGYCNAIGNIYTGDEYGKISIGTQDFIFTTPGIISAYNQAISIILNDFDAEDSIHELKRAFRDTLGNFYIRMWATSICELALQDGNQLNICDINSGALAAGFKSIFIDCLKQVFCEENVEKPNINFCNCYFNSETGEGNITMFINTFDLDSIDSANSISSTNLPLKNEPSQIIENSGDMARSKYLVLEERKLPVNNEITSNECIQVVSNYDLFKFRIEYQYKYL